MAINFEAANMAGYNNPAIEIVTLKISPSSEPVGTVPTYEAIHDILRRGIIPVLAFTDSSMSAYSVLPLSQYTSEMIAFSGISPTGDSNKPMRFTSVTFAAETPPNIQFIVYGPSIK